MERIDNFRSLKQWLGYPITWYSPKRRVLELLRVSDGVTELAVFVDAALKDVVEQAKAYLLELRNHLLCLRNRFVHYVQHRRNARLLSGCWTVGLHRVDVVSV